jgi:glycosyltransferase involved in cell wall biosynthesis
VSSIDVNNPKPILAVVHGGSFRGHPLGGIEAFLGTVLPRLSSAFDVKLVGMSLGEPLGHWTEIAIQGHPIPFLPVLAGRSCLRVPDRVRLAAGLLKYADEVVASSADVYYVHMTEAAISLMLTTRVPVIVHVHGLYNLFEYSRYQLGKTYARVYENFYPALFRRCAKVIGVGSREEFRNFSRLMKVRSGVAIPTCVRTDVFFRRDRSQDRKEVHIKDGDKVLLFVGRMTPTKNPRLLVECFRRLRPEFPCLKAVFIGDGPERQQIEDAARTHDGIIVLGQLPLDRIAVWMNAADALTVVSKAEAFTSIAALEALSCGTPVVATPVSALPEVIREGVNGAVAEDHSVDAYCSAVRRVLISPPAPSSCIASVVNYSPEAVSAQIIDQIHETLALNRAHHRRAHGPRGTLMPIC